MCACIRAGVGECVCASREGAGREIRPVADTETPRII